MEANNPKLGLNILREEVEFTFGRKILTSKDCDDLSDSIALKKGLLINVSTLRRCFGLVKSNHNPSISTLHILALYCGFSSYDELVQYKTSTGLKQRKDISSLLSYITPIFTTVQVQNPNDSTFIKLTRITIDFLDKNPDIAYEFQRAIVKTSNGKRFYFEHFVNIDKLNHFYGNGLRYYLAIYTHNDAQIFGLSILCLKYWLSEDSDNLIATYNKLNKFELTANTPLPIAARYFAAKLLYASEAGVDEQSIILEAYNYYKPRKQANGNVEPLTLFELIFAEALLVTEHYSEAYTFTSEGLRKTMLKTVPVESDIFKSFKLYHTIALANTGNEKAATDIFDQLTPASFYFTKYLFQTILYFKLGEKLGKIRVTNEQLNHLIEETGFKKMATKT